MHERAVLVGPAVVILRRRYIGLNGNQVGRGRDGREHLRRAHVRAAEHADFAVGVGQAGGPLDGIVAILAFVAERIEFALRIEASASVLNDDDIAVGGHCRRRTSAARPIVRRALEQHGKLALRLGLVNVGGKFDAVPHGHGDTRVNGHPVGLAEAAQGEN